MENKKNKLEEKTKELEKKAEEYLGGWKRERADFLNYKKDEMERIANLVKYANEEIILNILPILDNLCLASQHIQDDGVNQIKKQLEDFLKKEGIEPVETIGKPFNPNTMEAIETTSKLDRGPTSNQFESGTVVEEVQRGYTLHGKLIRPAKVRVTK